MAEPFAPSADLMTAPVPGTLWIELTSQCPFDCIFCSRAVLRGRGRHLDYALLQSLLGELSDPEVIRLNYSGESVHYPQLIPAIRLAKATGARTELVTALASATEGVIGGLIESRLDRLTVSLHTLDPDQYREIYRFASLEQMQAKLKRFSELRSMAEAAPELDMAFVAMKANLDQLQPVVRFAEELGCSGVSVFPVIHRDPIPFRCEDERHQGRLRPSFLETLCAALESARRASPIEITVCDPEFQPCRPISTIPSCFTLPLAEGARILTCEQNPWETAHILADGSVVPCEVQDRAVMGNLHRETLTRIWNGKSYRRFREDYVRGDLAECRACPWKVAYLPSPLGSSFVASGNRDPRLLLGWHEPDGAGTIWSKKRARIVLAGAPGRRACCIRGRLPQSTDRPVNRLEVIADGEPAGWIRNPTAGAIEFAACFQLSGTTAHRVVLEFRTDSLFCSAEAGLGRDRRRLGFALHCVEMLSQ